jgi:hypothetical protein
MASAFQERDIRWTEPGVLEADAVDGKFAS